MDLLTPIDHPVGVVQSFVAGLCGRDSQLIQPIELAFVLDAAAVPPSEVIPFSAVLATLSANASARTRLPVPPGFALARQVFAGQERLAPLLYCRKRNRIFAACSPGTCVELMAVPADAWDDADQSAAQSPPPELLIWDGPAAEGQKATIYGGVGESCPLGRIEPLGQLLLDQGHVVRRAVKLAKSDPVAANKLAAQHACCACPERKRCYPEDSGYAYALDRLVVINTADLPLVVLPLGEWRLDEAARMMGGVASVDVPTAQKSAANAVELWRQQQAKAIAAAGPARLLAGETSGRELLEIARLKLALIADALTQLDAAWQATGRPHLCWNDHTIRVTWQQPASTPATCWGFQPLLRKVGLQPPAPEATPDDRPLVYPPAFSVESLLSPAVLEGLRHFGQSRPAMVYVKSLKPSGADAARVNVLIEDFGIGWQVICPGDVLKIDGPGWEALLVPADQRDPDDGEGLPFVGQVTGQITAFEAGGQFDGCTCRWLPRFGEAVDLNALGMLLFETLLGQDERAGARLREVVATERAELTQACLAVEPEQREGQASEWIAARCESDSPGAVWSRRNLLYNREARAAIPLDPLPAELWRAVIAYGFRLATAIPGFSYCDARDRAAPRTTAGQLLPLVELRGLIALLDDLIFGRAVPGATLLNTLRAGS